MSPPGRQEIAIDLLLPVVRHACCVETRRRKKSRRNSEVPFESPEGTTMRTLVLHHPLVHVYVIYVVALFIAFLFASPRPPRKSARPDRRQHAL
jgi:hypothetical protein